MPSPADPVAFTLFGIGVRWYAIFILAGIVAAVALIRWLAERRGLDAEFPLDVAPWLVVGGVIGARLTYVLVRFDYFAQHPAEAFNVRLGGLAIHGALIAGALIFIWFCRRRNQPFWVWSDLVVAGVALGQAIGRWGNWANQEAFGRPTTLPWGLRIDFAHRPPQFADFATFHPTFLYESLFNLVNAAVLTWIALNIPRRDWLRSGDGLWTYCAAYGIGRLLIEQVRIDSLYIGPLPGPDWASGALVLLGLTMLARGRLRSTPAPRTGRGAPPPQPSPRSD
ncbi:MAG: prolipoprotein diacylglyceryl transferase [Thermomicrobiales bacterium]|nr:prolipoprotein diacylglyceryl transferase [Thermomicrobiales bacterium]